MIENTMTKSKKDKTKTKNTLVDKTLLESYKLSNANATKNRRWVHVLRKIKQFLFH